MTKIAKNASIRGLDETFVPAAGMGVERGLFTWDKSAGLTTLYDTVKRSPEVNAALSAIVEDIMADGWKYMGSKSAISNAEKFALQSKFFKCLSNAIFDLLITGNAYILKLSVSEDNIKDIARSMSDKILKDFALKKEEKTVFELIDQEFTKPKDLQLLKSSTMKVNYDETGKVASYTQEVNAKKRVYRPNDIIHLSLINVGGEPYGFSPLEPLLSDIATLIFAKEYAGKFFENDGVPHYMFNMPDEHPDSPNYKKFKQELKELKKSADKFRNLIITGNITAQEIAKFNKDMEYNKLIQHFTQLALVGLGVPSHRVHYVTTAEKTQGSQTNRALEGYYKRITFLQKIVEENLNVELWEPFNVDMKFKMAYLNDATKQANIVQILSQIRAITTSEARDMMGLDPTVPKELKQELEATGDDNTINEDENERMEEGQPNNEAPAPPVDNKLKELQEMVEKSILEIQKAEVIRTKEVLAMKKDLEIKEIELQKNEALKVKEIEIKQDLLDKQMKKVLKAATKKSKITDYVEISSYERFVLIVERYNPFNKAKILYKEDNGLQLFFSDGIWTYKTTFYGAEKELLAVCPFAVRIN